MDYKTYSEICQKLLDLSKAVEDTKRPAYTFGDADVLRNFKVSSVISGRSPLQEWLTLFNKHVLAVAAYVQNDSIPQAEPIEGRFVDLMNYVKLGFALYEESLIRE